MPPKIPTLEELFAEPSDEVKHKAFTMITRQRIQLLCSTKKSPFFAHLAMQLVLFETSQTATMATDGNYLYYNPKWVVAQEDEVLCTGICHEAMHPALGHLWRQGSREKERWNWACDYVINNMLDKNGFKVGEGWLLDHKYDNLSAEDVYAKLPKSKKGSGGGGLGTGQASPGDGAGTFDDHDMWDKAGSDPATGVENNEQVWKERMARAAMAAKLQGKLPSDIEGLVEDTLEPKLPWRDVLRNFIQDVQKTDFRMSPPNKRYLSQAIPLIMPSMKGEMLEIGIGRDTSGSMSDEQIKVCTSELLGIADTFENFILHIWDIDAQVQKYAVAETFDEVHDAVVKVKGRGGTDFRPLFKDIEEKSLNISCLVFMTDTLGTFPDAAPSYPVLWVVDQPERKVPFGDTLFLDMNE